MRSFKAVFLFLLPSLLFAQGQLKLEKKTSADGKYTYQYINNDPLAARIYTLENGLTVMMSTNRAEPRVTTAIAVKAGSVNDPKDATGLAHYLEHMLFKGTNEFGSLDFAKEKPLLDKIESLYQKHRETTDTTKRKEIYAEIDRVSGEAAKYAIANEYDKMLSSIGAKGTNAFTSFTQTVYINDIPANMMEKWLDIEAERFRNPQFRLFHTELEAVYEEKNISLDNDGRRMNEAVMSSLFPTHNYGQQTTIGTVEHLKNPSLEEIRKYFKANYVPNNMAVILSGDIDPDKMIVKVDKAFSYMKKAKVAKYEAADEQPLEGPIIKDITGPDAENVNIAYRFKGINSEDYKILTLIDMLLSNSQAGLIDLNLNQQQKIRDGYSYINGLPDYSIHQLGGQPREGQSLEEVSQLLLEQVELIKRGEFDDEMITAAINNLEIEQISDYESNWGRIFTLLGSFTDDRPWLNVVSFYRDLREITKDKIIDFANENYRQNYVVGYKHHGDKDIVTKVQKPKITPVETNREEQSAFLKEIIAREAPAVSPRFIDYEKDIEILSGAGAAPIHYVRNKENSLFTMYYVLDRGSMHDKSLAMAINYLPYLGTDKLSAEEVQIEFYKLGCSFDVNASSRQVYVSVTGLDRNFEAALTLFEDLLRNCAPNEEALQNLISDERKEREDAKLSKRRILYGGMWQYGRHGKRNPFNDVLSDEELNGLSSSDLIEKIRTLTNYQHRILYYGPAEADRLTKVIKEQHKVPQKLTDVAQEIPYEFVKSEGNKVYFVNYDMVQAEVLWVANSTEFDAAKVPTISMYNEYYGGNMSSIVFQTIRESKALAYSTWSSFSQPYRAGEPFMAAAYIGTQSDKLEEAVNGMNELLTEMPEANNLFTGSREAIKNRIETERIIRTGILFNYENAMRKGLKNDPRQAIYKSVDDISFEDVKAFHKAHIAGSNYTLLVLGSKDKVDFEVLKKFGTVEELSLKTLFGY